MKHKCDICGCESDEYWMMPFNIGSKTIWLCWDCYKNSQYEATKSDLSRQKKLYQIANSKKRHR